MMCIYIYIHIHIHITDTDSIHVMCSFWYFFVYIRCMMNAYQRVCDQSIKSTYQTINMYVDKLIQLPGARRYDDYINQY